MRVANRTASSLLAVVLIVGGLLIAVEAILFAVGRRSWLLPLTRWHDTLTSTTFADPAVRAIAIGLAVLGLLILVAQLRPWRPDQLTVSGAAGDTVRWRMRRRSVEHRVASAVSGVAGVSGATAAVQGDRNSWRVKVKALARPEQLSAIEAAARGALDRLSASPDVAVRVDVHTPRRVV